MDGLAGHGTTTASVFHNFPFAFFIFIFVFMPSVSLSLINMQGLFSFFLRVVKGLAKVYGFLLRL